VVKSGGDRRLNEAAAALGSWGRRVRLVAELKRRIREGENGGPA
jgi:hypothetical protein